MISRANAQYWDCFNALPDDIQRIAKEKYRLWEKDCFHPSLHFKPLKDDLWSARINRSYRAVGRRKGELIVWVWVGTHAEYDKLMKHASF